MKASLINSALCFVGLAWSHPPAPQPQPQSSGLQLGSDCIPRHLANEWLQRFMAVIGQQPSDLGDAKTTANLILADNFQEKSNGILLLEGRSLSGDGIAEYSKQSFISNLFKYPAYTGINTIKVLLDCDQLVWHYYYTGIGTKQYPVRGFNNWKLQRAYDGCPSQIQALDMTLEFDSLAWALDTGYTAYFQNGTKYPSIPYSSPGQH
ncbi:Hypothetical predicted protein [Lecanosticta acicola]|uniref:NTF2-like domain-containing protein n=1 Tax=Lecanosticta acicola TaxID=111012 RepID=A0AAI8YWY2_9PEZI|nr:Hypothetical predicted protein [Lecanosticta acicola]